MSDDTEQNVQVDHTTEAKALLERATDYSSESQLEDALASIAHSLIELTEALKMGAVPQKWSIDPDPALVRRFEADLTEAIKRGPTGITYLHMTDALRGIMSPDQVREVFSAEPALRDIRVLDTNHTPDVCAGFACCFHNPSQHPLTAAPLIWHEDDRMMFRVCEHGREHPDIDYWRYALELLGRSEWHVCDGCCLTERLEA